MVTRFLLTHADARRQVQLMGWAECGLLSACAALRCTIHIANSERQEGQAAGWRHTVMGGRVAALQLVAGSMDGWVAV